MDPLFSLLIALVVAFPVLAIVALVLAIGARERLRKLEFKLAGLEGQLSGLAPQPAPAPTPAPEAVKEREAKIEELAAPPAPEEPPATAPAPPVPPLKPHISLEERFGTQWVVWAGGIALALGGFFLVRYSIEQGWFGPAARVLLAGIVALALIAAGEWTRRREIKSGCLRRISRACSPPQELRLPMPTSMRLTRSTDSSVLLPPSSFWALSPSARSPPR
jgi:predicted membrane protein DUF2339